METAVAKTKIPVSAGNRTLIVQLVPSHFLNQFSKVDHFLNCTKHRGVSRYFS
jgi:hypothetical protein